MRTSCLISALAVAAPAVLAQNSTSNSTSLCDKYAMALFKANNATTQYTLLTALVNTALIGNYTTDPAPKNAVTGILNNGTFVSQPVSLLKYFNGMLASTNRGGDSGVSVNFLDGGGADPLKMNKPANGTTSNQYFLLTHLYEYFGSLLGCSTYGMNGFPAYEGGKSQYQVHKFMDLSHAEVSYFIQEVGLAATSFGVTAEEAMAVGQKLGQTFNYRCLPETTVIKAQGPALQSICIGDNCPKAMNPNCEAYQDSTMPSPANDTNKFTSTSMMPSSTAGSGSDSTGTPTDSGSGNDQTGVAAANSLGAVFMGVAGFAALAAGL